MNRIYILWKILLAIRKLRVQARFSHEQLETHRNDALQSLREYAYERSPFYRKFHMGLTDRPLHELPILTKNILMENFDDLVTDRRIKLADVREYIAHNVDKLDDRHRYLGRYWVTATSGSSGYPGVFLFDSSEWVSVIASFARGREWSGLKIALLPRFKIIMVASNSPWHLSSRTALTANTWATPFMRLASNMPLEKIVEHLNRHKPDLLVAYSAMSRVLAEEQLSGRLQIHPKKIYTSAEVLTPQTRQKLNEVWGAELYNQYGATETADIAAEYRACHRMHAYEDLLIIENVDEKNRPVPRGEFGAKLLVTTLFSRTQPLIRYEINDSVRFSAAECPDCNLPFSVIDEIQGRKEDVIFLQGQKGKPVLIQPLVFNRIMDILPVTGWQIIQNKDDSLTILLSRGSGGHENFQKMTLLEKLKKDLTAEGAVAPQIYIQFVSEIPKSPSGKTPLIKSKNPL